MFINFRQYIYFNLFYYARYFSYLWYTVYIIYSYDLVNLTIIYLLHGYMNRNVYRLSVACFFVLGDLYPIGLYGIVFGKQFYNYDSPRVLPHFCLPKWRHSKGECLYTLLPRGWQWGLPKSGLLNLSSLFLLHSLSLSLLFYWAFHCFLCATSASWAVLSSCLFHCALS